MLLVFDTDIDLDIIDVLQQKKASFKQLCAHGLIHQAGYSTLKVVCAMRQWAPTVVSALE